MLLTTLKKIYNTLFSFRSYKMSHPTTVYKTWRNITEKLVSEKYFQSANLNNVWRNYPGKKDRQVIIVQGLQNVIESRIPGVVAEFGCYQGHTAIQIARNMGKMGDKSPFFLFDSFQGVPESTHPDDRYWKKGALTAEYCKVKERFASFENVKIVKGYFRDVLSDYSDLNIKFAHVDADLYTSIKEVNEWLLPRLHSGGIIIYDDYGFETCPGAMKAVDEDLGGRCEFLKWYLPTGQFIAIKSIL